MKFSCVNHGITNKSLPSFIINLDLTFTEEQFQNLKIEFESNETKERAIIELSGKKLLEDNVKVFNAFINYVTNFTNTKFIIKINNSELNDFTLDFLNKFEGSKVTQVTFFGNQQKEISSYEELENLFNVLLKFKSLKRIKLPDCPLIKFKKSSREALKVKHENIKLQLKEFERLIELAVKFDDNASNNEVFFNSFTELNPKILPEYNHKYPEKRVLRVRKLAADLCSLNLNALGFTIKKNENIKAILEEDVCNVEVKDRIGIIFTLIGTLKEIEDKKEAIIFVTSKQSKSNMSKNGLHFKYSDIKAAINERICLLKGILKLIVLKSQLQLDEVLSCKNKIKEKILFDLLKINKEKLNDIQLNESIEKIYNDWFQNIEITNTDKAILSHYSEQINDFIPVNIITKLITDKKIYLEKVEGDFLSQIFPNQTRSHERITSPNSTPAVIRRYLPPRSMEIKKSVGNNNNIN